MTAIDVTNPETAAWLKSKLFQADDGNDGMGDKNAALNNLRAELYALQKDRDAQFDEKIALRDTVAELTQDNEILREELASAREQLQAVA